MQSSLLWTAEDVREVRETVSGMSDKRSEAKEGPTRDHAFSADHSCQVTASLVLTFFFFLETIEAYI